MRPHKPPTIACAWGLHMRTDVLVCNHRAQEFSAVLQGIRTLALPDDVEEAAEGEEEEEEEEEEDDEIVQP